MPMFCVICGGEFTRRAPKQVTCGKSECMQERQRQHVRNYNQRQREIRMSITVETTVVTVRRGRPKTWSEILSNREQHNPGKWYACPAVDCRRTNLIKPDKDRTHCWRCGGLVVRYELPKKDTDGSNPGTVGA